MTFRTFFLYRGIELLSHIIKERVHKNSITSDKIESYLLIQPIGFILNTNFFVNSYSSSGQNMVHIQGSAAAHPGVCSNTSRVCNTTSGVCIPQNTDCGCGVTDSGCVTTDPWMGCYRFLDVSIQTPGCAPYFGWNFCNYFF